MIGKVGILSNGNGNENVIKAIIGLLSKKNKNDKFARAIRVFLYISLPLLHDYHVTMPNFMFYGERKQATTKYSFSFKTCVQSPIN